MIQQNYKNNVEAASGDIKTTGFSIDINESMFAMLTAKVYNDPVLAVVREWSTNACDACLAAGKEVDYDVHLPTLDNLTFYVRDYGTGLSTEDIEGLFSNLGASTKRDSNKFNGTLGIGRMAGLAVSSAFSVDSYHNGKLHSYVISIQNGVPVTMHLGSTDTSEPNGLKLSVAVELDDIQRYKERATYLYRYFTHKPDLNIDINTDLKVAFEGNSGWFVEEYDYSRKNCNYVVMAQVAYEIPYNNDIDTKGFTNLVIKADPGSVTFNPGRESLSLDKPTIEYLNNKFKEVVKEYKDIVETSFVLCNSDVEVMNTYNSAVLCAPHTVKDLIDPAPYISTYYEKLQNTPSYNNRFGAFYHLGPNDNFVNDTNNLLSLSHKYGHYINAKTMNTSSYLPFHSFFDAKHVIIDVKTKFKKALSKKYKSCSYIAWTRTAGSDIDQAVEKAKEYITGLGLEYELASEIVKEFPEEKTTKESRSGLYASDVTFYNSSVTKSTKMTEEQYNEGTYLYLKLDGTKPSLSNSSYSFDDYCNAYVALRCVKDMPPVKGISKKYQSIVDDLDNWVDFETYVLDAAKKATFRDADSGFSASTNWAVIGDNNFNKYPDRLADYYYECKNYNQFVSDKSCIGSHLKSVVEKMGASFDTFKPSKNVDIDDIKKVFKISFPVISRNSFDVNNADILIKVAKLEEYYAIHSTK